MWTKSLFRKNENLLEGVIRRFIVSANPFKIKQGLVLSKMTRYEVEKYNNPEMSDTQLERLIRERGSDYDSLLEHHCRHKDYERYVLGTLDASGITTKVVSRLDYSPNWIDWCDAVFPVGGDGTFLHAASRVPCDSKPVIGFNSDPDHSEGFLCLDKAHSHSVMEVLKKLKEGSFSWMFRTRIRLTMKTKTYEPPVELHDNKILGHHNRTTPIVKHMSSAGSNQPLSLPHALALNEVFVGESLSAHVSFFELELDGGGGTKLKSSGMCVCSGTGSTSWHLSMNRVTKHCVAQVLHSAGHSHTDRCQEIADKYNRQLLFHPGYGVEDKMPTIAIVAHYDSFGVAPELSFGADSNGSGVAMLLELARLFSHLYANTQTHARANLLFLLSGGGKLNYLGSKKWLEDQLDGVDTSLLQEASFVLCLDTVAGGGPLHLHVSKPPRDGSYGANFLNELNRVRSASVPVEVVHKKINLAEELLAWEHERYSIRKLPAFTLSSLKSHKAPIRGTILDTRSSVDVSLLARNTEVVAQALARHLYNLSDNIYPFSWPMSVESDSLRSYLEMLTNKPRSAQLLAEKQNPLVYAMTQALNGYVKDVKVTHLTPDKRDPEFIFYDVTKATVNVYSVKPAVFDLFLTFAIVIYLAVIYVFIQGFPMLYSVMLRFTTAKKSKGN